MSARSCTPNLRLPYLRRVSGASAPHFAYVALTHYHKDHYNGLRALATGAITADPVIDPVGYPIGRVFPNQQNVHNLMPPPFNPDTSKAWTDILGMAVSHGFVKGHTTALLSFENGPHTSLGHRITLGTVNGLPVRLECVAGWGNTLQAQGIAPDRAPGRQNPNDFTIAFILSCGQFRYLIAGDLGGEDHTPYLDQESPLSAHLAAEYPSAWSADHRRQAAGHICGFKADHHGSEHSNQLLFMQHMTPAITVVSAGHQPKWHLPSPVFVQRLSQVGALSTPPAPGYSRGVYITNLYDFPNFPSKSSAIQQFGHPGNTSFSYGNASPGQKSGYLIRVNPQHLDKASAFAVYRTDQSAASVTLLASFTCHQQ